MSENNSENNSSEESKEFTPITSQDALDKVISARLERERAKFSDYSELKTKAARLDEIEEANQSELEKLQSKLAKAEAKVADFELTAQVNAWKAQVSEETGIPVKALAGNTLEEIQAHGETLAELMAPKEDEQQAQKVIVRSEGSNSLPLNGEGIEDALRNALGIA